MLAGPTVDVFVFGLRSDACWHTCQPFVQFVPLEAGTGTASMELGHVGLGAHPFFVILAFAAGIFYITSEGPN